MQESNKTPRELKSSLKLFNDEPDDKSKLFRFNEFSEQLTLVLLEKSLPTPFCIGLDGDWGSGKTSLIKKVYLKLQNQEEIKKVNIVWFDAWAYERLDPISSLMYTIANEFGNKGETFKKNVKKLIPVADYIPSAIAGALGVHLPPINIAGELKNFLSKDENQPYFTITKELTKMIGNEKRLIIFVDDLDRCSVDNVLDIFETIKIFLNAPNVVFVVAADMKKLEGVWMERYGSKYSSPEEGREHIEKIFQLKISLPPKQSVDIKEYLNTLKIDISQFNDLLIQACPANPRKIKRILNLIYFVTGGINDSDFFDLFPLVILWSIMSVTYPEMARLVKLDPRTLFRVSTLVRYYEEYGNLITGKKPVEDINLDKMYGNESPTQLHITDQIIISFKRLRGLDIEGLRLVIKDHHLFEFLKSTSKYYSIPEYSHTTSALELDRDYLQHAKSLKKVIDMQD